jgi:hypothetical protein
MKTTKSKNLIVILTTWQAIMIPVSFTSHQDRRRECATRISAANKRHHEDPRNLIKFVTLALTSEG